MGSGKHLTLNMQKFINNIVAGMSQRQAYRGAYEKSVKWKDETVDSKASNLFNSEKVQTRYNEIINKAAEKAIITRSELLKGLTEAFYMGMAKANTPMVVKSRVPYMDKESGNLIPGCFTEELIEVAGKNADLKGVSSIANTIMKLEGYDKPSKIELSGKVMHDKSEKVLISEYMELTKSTYEDAIKILGYDPEKK